MSQAMVVKKDAEVLAVTARPIDAVEDLRNAFESLRGKANVVCPVSNINSVLKLHKVSLRAVMIDSAVDEKGNGREVYRGKFCAGNERALGKVALNKITNAAGVVTLSRRRLDDRSDPHYCEIEVTRGFREFDGTWRQETKTKAVDLRNGSPNAIAMTPNSLAQQRSVIQELAESKAGLRADRALLAIPQKFTLIDLALPFVVPKLIPSLDPNVPKEHDALIAMATGREAMLFGPQPSESARTMKELNPAPPIEPGTKAPPPVGTVQPDPEDEAEGAGGEADDFSLPNLEDEPALIVCLCPCGCQKAISEGTAETTTNVVGAARCKECFPGKDFDFAKHKDLRDLKLPKFPGKTAEDIRAAHVKAKTK